MVKEKKTAKAWKKRNHRINFTINRGSKSIFKKKKMNSETLVSTKSEKKNSGTFF